MYLSRVRTFVYLARTVPIFRFDIGGQVSDSAALLLDTCATLSANRRRDPIDTSEAVPSVEHRKVVNQSKSPR